MRWKSLVAALVAVLAAGCARNVETSVTRFHGGHLPQGASFTVLPADQSRHGPEFERYAVLIRDEMSLYGFRPGNGGAELRVEIDYAVSEGRTKIESRPGYAYPAYSYRVGAFHHPYHHGFYSPHLFGGYLGPDIRSETVFTRTLGMRIMAADSGEVLFEGRAVSEGPTQEISLIMPYLVESMFRNFPGESGTTKVVEIETRNGSRY